MNRQLRLMSFSLRQFLTVPYFLQLLLLSTFGATALQALAAGAWPVDATLAWTRAGIIGTWNMCIVAAGILNFERYRGTFVYLLNGAVNPLRALAAVVSTASIFGLAALPLAWVFWALCTFSVDFTDFTQVGARYLVGLPLLWVSCLAVTFVIAGFFVATPNAIAYEELLLVPVFVASGVLFTESSAPAWLDALGTLIPIQAPVKVLLGQMPMNSFGDFLGVVLQTCAVTALWMLAAYLLGRRALRAATVHGTLGAI